MKSSEGIWVICLSCGHQYFLERHTSKMKCRCPKCVSKEYIVADDYGDEGTIHDIETIKAIGGPHYGWEEES
jgi:Zn finger protein HypA/HybF involved in hydrogenase expression